MRDLFGQDSARFDKFFAAIRRYRLRLLEESHHRRNDGVSCFDLARQAGLAEAIGAMFSGQKINKTESRAVLHVALRNRSNRPILVDGDRRDAGSQRVLAKMRAVQRGDPLRRLAGLYRRRDHRRRQHRHRRVGPGAEDGGQRAHALRAPGACSFHFVSNVDATDIAETIKCLNPATTLFLVASKTFTTQETMANAATARAWFLNAAHKTRRRRQTFRRDVHQQRLR